MLWMKWVFFLGVLLAFFGSAMAFNPFFLEGYINEISIDKNLVLAGGSLKLELDLWNQSQELFQDGYFVVQVVQIGDRNGNTYFKENIVAEYKLPAENLVAGEEKSFSYEIKVPGFVKSGSYRLDAYFKTPRAFVVGIPFIFVSPRSVNFEVVNEGVARDIAINRKETKICGILSELDFNSGCFAGPVGVIMQSGSKNTMHFVLDNRGTRAETITLKMRFYAYDDTEEENFEKELIEELGVVGAGQQLKKDIEFTAPKTPKAYSILLEVFGEGGALLSIFRHRVITEGESARILDYTTSKPAYRAGDTVTLFYRLIPAADSKTEVKNAVLVFEVLDENGNTVFSKNQFIDLVPAVPLIIDKLSFTAPKNLKNVVLRIKVQSAVGKTLDEYKTKVETRKFTATVSELKVKISVDASFKAETRVVQEGQPFFVQARAFDLFGSPLSQQVKMFIESKRGRAGPINVNEVLEYKDLLPVGKYSLFFSAGKLTVTKALEVLAPTPPFSEIGVDTTVKPKEKKQNITSSQPAIPGTVVQPSKKTLPFLPSQKQTPLTVTPSGMDNLFVVLLIVLGVSALILAGYSILRKRWLK